jgi:hypothetical protein
VCDASNDDGDDAPGRSTDDVDDEEDEDDEDDNKPIGDAGDGIDTSAPAALPRRVMTALACVSRGADVNKAAKPRTTSTATSSSERRPDANREAASKVFAQQSNVKIFAAQKRQQELAFAYESTKTPTCKALKFREEVCSDTHTHIIGIDERIHCIGATIAVAVLVVVVFVVVIVIGVVIRIDVAAGEVFVQLLPRSLRRRRLGRQNAAFADADLDFLLLTQRTEKHPEGGVAAPNMPRADRSSGRRR